MDLCNCVLTEIIVVERDNDAAAMKKKILKSVPIFIVSDIFFVS